jgi:FKBP-type peptidyl-prolyl cis-trans isomerase FklB
MKKATTIFASALALGAMALASCSSDDDTWDDYADWREANTQWLAAQEATGLYTRVVPDWNKGMYVLMRWLNDTTETSGNLTPLYTSQVTVKYYGTLYDGTPFDSTYLYTDSVLSINLNTCIYGWAIAMERMHVGDEVEVLLPYNVGYGSTESGSIKPYSALRFQMKLTDIPYYEIKPE